MGVETGELSREMMRAMHPPCGFSSWLSVCLLPTATLLAGTSSFRELKNKNTQHPTTYPNLSMAMDLFTFVSALLALCFQATPLVHGFSSQIFIHANPPFYQTGRLAASGDEDAASNVRKPWDVLRFVSQSSKFVKTPSLPLIGVGKKGIKRRVGPGM
jgi:hypothetical protein